MTDELLLAADVGGTKTNLALLRAPGDLSRHGDPGAVVASATYASGSFASLEELLEAFRTGADAGRGKSLAAATIGYAGAVADGIGEGSNLPWKADAAALARHLGLKRVGLINDLVAAGYGIATLRPEQQVLLLPGVAAADGHAAIIAAGTGLGETILTRVDGDFVPIPSEGGHADFAPRGDLELEIWSDVRRRYGRVSVERLLSGPGLVNIARVIHARRGAAAFWAEHEVAADAAENLPALVSDYALERRCPACAESLDLFAGIYGSEAGNLALRCVGRGGIFIAGGIAPRILPALRSSTFERAFRDKEPHEALLAKIPVSVILDDKLPLWGAARHASLSLRAGP